jgi:hypothetical protein
VERITPDDCLNKKIPRQHPSREYPERDRHNEAGCSE